MREYVCRSCHHAWEQSLSLAEYRTPCTQPCPACLEPDTIDIQIGAPMLGDPWRLGRRHTPEAFKEVLREIKRKVPGNTIDVR